MDPTKMPNTPGSGLGGKTDGSGRSRADRAIQFRGRGQYCGGHGQARGSQAGYRSSLKFMGTCEGLKGMVYNCNNDCATGMKLANTYIQTTQALSIYIGSTCKNGMDINSSIDHMQKPKFALPTTLPTMVDEGKKIKYKVQVEGIAKHENTFEENMDKLFSVILGQCTELMKERIRNTIGYMVVSKNQDGLAILKMIQKICLNFEDGKYLPLAMIQVKKQYFAFWQEPRMTILKYHTSFLNMQNALINCGACNWGGSQSGKLDDN